MADRVNKYKIDVLHDSYRLRNLLHMIDKKIYFNETESEVRQFNYSSAHYVLLLVWYSLSVCNLKPNACSE